MWTKLYTMPVCELVNFPYLRSCTTLQLGAAELSKQASRAHMDEGKEQDAVSECLGYGENFE